MQRQGETIASLLKDVASGIRVLATRDGVALSEPQVWERARNIVAGLMGNYRIVSFDQGDDDDDDDDDDQGRGPSAPRNDRDHHDHPNERQGLPTRESAAG